MAQMQSLVEEIHIFLTAGTSENIPRERWSFLLSLCFCLSIHYLPTLETGYWARWTFALIQLISFVFSLPPKESQNNV